MTIFLATLAALLLVAYGAFLRHAMRHAETRPCPITVPKRVGVQRSRVPVCVPRGSLLDISA